MDSGRRPSLNARTVSNPPAANPTAQRNIRNLSLKLLTPPTSPRQIKSSTDLTTYASSQRPQECELPLQTTEDGTIICPYSIEILRDQQGRNQIFGFGAWSTVFKGTCHSKAAQTSGFATPPLSPSSPSSRPPVLVAVKTPARKEANSILLNEAKILTKLMSMPYHEMYITTFYGILPENSSLVLAAHPLSLEQHIITCAKRAREMFSTSNMFTPVIGSTQIWLDLAYQLISTLDWLHNDAQIIHGDVKPGNILLQAKETDEVDKFSFTPLMVDFSSAQRLDTNDITPNTLSAVTREYTAPELLNSAVLRDPKSTATPDSDVFSLAITLLVAATGETMVYSGSVFQRQMAATQGWAVMDFVRGGDQGSRVPRHGVVSRALERAVLKKDMGRISASRWKTMVEEMMMSQDPSKL